MDIIIKYCVFISISIKERIRINIGKVFELDECILAKPKNITKRRQKTEAKDKKKLNKVFPQSKHAISDITRHYEIFKSLKISETVDQ